MSLMRRSQLLRCSRRPAVDGRRRRRLAAQKDQSCVVSTPLVSTSSTTEASRPLPRPTHDRRSRLVGVAGTGTAARPLCRRMATRRGFQVAVVAVARKMTVLCRHLITKDQDYSSSRPGLNAHNGPIGRLETGVRALNASIAHSARTAPP
jgi:hypothetical protein